MSTISLSKYLLRSHPLPPSTPLARQDLKLAVLRNAPVETEGFTLTLFVPDVAVSHNGTIHKLMQDDFNRILNLASQISTLPTTDRFFNTWVIDQPRTSRPIDRILVPLGTLDPKPKETYAEEYREVSVQGYEKGRIALKENVEGYTELPGVLQDLMAAVLEAQEGESEKDDEVITRVKELLGNVF
ncbi:hypothetical protein BDQ17DRAFT_1289243 [Cyathus striatus]|nr:hypothetical protein BDQ17DRAFT_1289243 [Cyathus striatus]